MNAEDALKYALALLKGRTNWATDSIGGSCCEISHEAELEEISDVVHTITKLVGRFGDPRFYSDGRRVKSSAEIEYGDRVGVIWHPNPHEDEPRSWPGMLMSDPGVPSPGMFVVRTDPLTQSIDVSVMRDDVPDPRTPANVIPIRRSDDERP